MGLVKIASRICLEMDRTKIAEEKVSNLRGAAAAKADKRRLVRRKGVPFSNSIYSEVIPDFQIL